MPAANNANEFEAEAKSPDATGVVLSVSDSAAWPKIKTAARITLRGALQTWSLCNIHELLHAIEGLPEQSLISIELGADESKEDLAGFELITKVVNAFAGRIIVAFQIACQDTFYGRSAEDQQRSLFLAEAARFFGARNAPVRWFIPLNCETVYRLEGLFLTARELSVEADISCVDACSLCTEDRLFAVDYIRYRILDEASWPINAVKRKGYETIIQLLESDYSGSFYGICASILSLKPTIKIRPKRSRRLDFVREAAGVLIDGARAYSVAVFQSKNADQPIAAGEHFEKVLLIGAYGGEHIGDAAILGGVALRLHQRHGVKSAILMSQRPAHTKHLISMIDTPVEIEVREYLHREIDACVDEVDAVIFAGGPIVDLPKQLVRHLYAVSSAKTHGKPFLMEGVGPGPLHRLPSRMTARKIISLADHVSLRTKESAEAEIVRGIEFEVGRDPAFDYLETRRGELSKMPEKEIAEIERLLDGACDRPVIGVNIRPIYHQYTVGVKDADKASYTKMVEDRFERRMAEALTQFSRSKSAKPVIVFFPMNAVQFGLSDLTSAFRIVRHLGQDVDYRVWEADASLDGVVALIRRLNIAITMRFHATTSQKTTVSSGNANRSRNWRRRAS